MAMLTTAILALSIAATTTFLLPQLIGGLLGLLLRGAGWLIRRRTRSRREYVIARARSDEEELNKTLRATDSTSAQARSSTEDEDWEKVDSNAGPGGGRTPTNSDGGSGEEAKKPDDWDGIIGFFHPFWYGHLFFLWLCCRIHRPDTLTSITVTLVAAENEFCGKQYGQHRGAGPRRFAPFTLVTMKSTRQACLNESRIDSISAYMPLQWYYCT